jgi:hypothetical protein
MRRMGLKTRREEGERMPSSRSRRASGASNEEGIMLDDDKGDRV